MVVNKPDILHSTCIGVNSTKDVGLPHSAVYRTRSLSDLLHKKQQPLRAIHQP